MGIFNPRGKSKAGQKAFRAGKKVSAKHAAAHAETVKRRAEFKARKKAAGK